jgi:hypothetical protein
MDASQITKLLQKQNTTYINNNRSIDSSTLIWQNQIKSSKVINNTPTSRQSKTTTISMDSSKRIPDVLGPSKGSATQVYSSDNILLQKASEQFCGSVKGPNTVTIPQCYCVNTNGPTNDNPNPPVNNNTTNPFLPPFDTYYLMKNKQQGPLIFKHYVRK